LIVCYTPLPYKSSWGARRLDGSNQDSVAVVGLRVFGALVAGTSRMPWGKFALYNVLGGTIWATAALSLGYFLWASISLVEHWVGRASLLLLAALALALLLRWAYRRVTHG
jgi:membrane protein DedA with SNARE-associated domain